MSIDELTIYDMLGKQSKRIENIASTVVSFDIDKSLSAGTYIVRVGGKDIYGKSFVVSKQLVVE